MPVVQNSNLNNSMAQADKKELVYFKLLLKLITNIRMISILEVIIM